MQIGPVKLQLNTSRGRREPKSGTYSLQSSDLQRELSINHICDVREREYQPSLHLRPSATGVQLRHQLSGSQEVPPQREVVQSQEQQGALRLPVQRLPAADAGEPRRLGVLPLLR